MTRRPSRVQDGVRREYRVLAPVYERIWARYLRVSINRTLARVPLWAGARVLDLGCGTGLLLARIRGRQPDVELEGIELSPAMLARARERLGPSVGLALGSAQGLPHPDDHVDVVTCSSVLHDIAHDHAAVLREWLRVLRPGGTIVITDWDPEHWGTRLRLLALALIGRRPQVHTPHEIADLLAAAGVSRLSRETYTAGGWGLWTVAGINGPRRPAEIDGDAQG